MPADKWFQWHRGVKNKWENEKQKQKPGTKEVNILKKIPPSPNPALELQKKKERKKLDLSRIEQGKKPFIPGRKNKAKPKWQPNVRDASVLMTVE